MQRWVDRTEARWGLCAGIAGAVATAALGTKMILTHGSPAAGLGFVFLPLVAAAAAVPVAIWGAALGHVFAHLRGRAAEPKIVLWVALAASASLPAVLGYEIWRGKSLETAIAETRSMTSRELERAFHESKFRGDKFFLGALAQHPAASAELLEAIARLEDAALSEPMGSLWDVMGENRKGEPVLALAARHPNATASVKRRAPR
jgi:hypothetical protein